jgi:hypothetical protein
MVERKPGQTGNEKQLTATSGIERLEQRWERLSHEQLVEIIGGTVDEARELCEAKWGEGSFDPVVWIGELFSMTI